MHSTILVISEEPAASPCDAVERKIRSFTLPFEAVKSGQVLAGWWDVWADSGIPVPFDSWRVETRTAFGADGVISLRGANRAALRRRFDGGSLFAGVIVNRTLHCASEFIGRSAHLPVRVGRAGNCGAIVVFTEADREWDAALYNRFIRRLTAAHVLIAVDVHH
jgi:hypothetical protein